MPLWAFIVTLILVLVIFVEVMFVISSTRQTHFCTYDQSPRCFGDWLCAKWWPNDKDPRDNPDLYGPFPSGLDPTTVLDESGTNVVMSRINRYILDACKPVNGKVDETKCKCTAKFNKFTGNGAYGVGDQSDSQHRVGLAQDNKNANICAPKSSPIVPITVDLSKDAVHPINQFSVITPLELRHNRSSRRRVTYFDDTFI
jgi:hypothetical protein